MQLVRKSMRWSSEPLTAPARILKLVCGVDDCALICGRHFAAAANSKLLELAMRS